MNTDIIIEAFSPQEQEILLKYTKKFKKESNHHLLTSSDEMYKHSARNFRLFIDELIQLWKTEHKYIKEQEIPDELLGIYEKAKQYTIEQGFEYEWNREALSEGRIESYLKLSESIRKKGVDFGNLVINEKPIEGLECILDYGSYCEVFFFKDGKKDNLRRFDKAEEAKEYYKNLILSNPQYFVIKVHFKHDDKEALLYYAKLLGEDLVYDIFNNEKPVTDAKTARHISKFFWEMADASAYDHHEGKGEGYYIDEFMLNTIGGFLERSGFEYQWYREESTPERLAAAHVLKEELIKEGVDMSKVLINEDPKEGHYCFLDYGDHCKYFYYQDNEEEDEQKSYKSELFEKMIKEFKEWMISLSKEKS